MNTPTEQTTVHADREVAQSEPMAAEKSKRIIMFCDLRASTEILLNFEQGLYSERSEEGAISYEEFIHDVHKTAYEYLYLGHNKTHTEIYGDGLMAIFPEDNTQYIMENIYRLTGRMREYNDSTCVNPKRPPIDIGFGITTGEIALVYYYLDQRYHPIGIGVHEAARIEARSKFYDARILVSEHFFRDVESFIAEDSRFGYRFIDRVQLKNFRTPVTMYEILVDNDPRFARKIASIPVYAEAYEAYRRGEWEVAKTLFRQVYDDYGLGTGRVMANRCDLLAQRPIPPEWDGVWSMRDK